MPLNSSRSGAVNYTGDVDYFYVNAPGPGTLTVFTTGTTDTFGYLLSPSGAILASGDDIEFPNNRNFTFSAALPGQGGPYYICVRHFGAYGTGAYQTLTVNWAPQSPPVITTQPSSATVTSGSTASLTVAASGQAPLTYQWRFNGAPISGANAATYTISNVGAGHAGNYDVIIANNSGSVTSVTVSLTVAASINNGSFELGYSSWTQSGNQSSSLGAPYVPSDGSTLVVFNASDQTPNGNLSQTFSTIAGRTYEVAFDVGVYEGTPAGTFYRAINVGGNSIQIDGRNWEGEGASNYSSQKEDEHEFPGGSITFSPAVGSATSDMLRTCVVGPNVQLTPELLT